MTNEGQFEQYQLTDFTTISGWEQLTAEMGTLFKSWQKSTTSQKGTVRYKGVSLSVHLVLAVEYSPVLAGLSPWDVSCKGESTVELVARVFARDQFVLVQCGSDFLMSCNTARLVLSSMLLNAMDGIPALLLVEYNEGDIMGASANEGDRLSYTPSLSVGEQAAPLILSQLGSFCPLGGRRNLHSSCCQTLYRTSSVRLVEMMLHYCSKLIQPSCPQWGCRDDPIREFQLQTIYPQLTPHAFLFGTLPDPFDAPIWMLIVSIRPRQPTFLASAVENLTTIQSSDAFTAKNLRMHQIMSTSGANPSDFIEIPFSPSKDHSFMERIALCLLLALERRNSLPSPDAMINALCSTFADFWRALVARLRWHVERQVSLPDVPQFPDLGSSLLEQKLAMLNYCIVRQAGKVERRGKEKAATLLDALAEKHRIEGERRQREQFIELTRKGRSMLSNLGGALALHVEEEENPHKTCSHDQDSSSAEDAIFFDALDELVAIDETEAKLAVETVRGEICQRNVDETVLREGKLKQLEGKKLLETGEDLWIPITQDAGVITSDMITSHKESLTRLQCAQLVSDMQAFKAANPGAILADFVRWHSPKDWLEGDQLSARMATPNNLWQQLWGACEALPVSRQKLLFDPFHEGEKALFWFEDLLLLDLLQHLLPFVLSTIAAQINRLCMALLGIHSNIPGNDKDSSTEQDSSAPSKCTPIIEPLLPPSLIDSDSLDMFCKSLGTIENRLSEALVLKAQLPPSTKIASLLSGQSILIAAENDRDLVRALFSSSTDEPDREFFFSQTQQSPVEGAPSTHWSPRTLYIRHFGGPYAEIGIAESSSCHAQN